MEDPARFLSHATRVTVLTGAGVSAESGIPTFREALAGLWEQYDPEELATPQAFRRNPQLVWDWYAERRARVVEARPNPAHYALAEIEQRVPEFTLLTQNVDGLHREAGSRNIVELHGNIRRVRCADCGIVVDRWEEAEDGPPHCLRCDGLLRPDVIWFGEHLPAGALEAGWHAAETCDLFLSVGTSNLVEPAASLPWLAHRHGAAVIVVNTTSEGQHTGPRIHHLVGKAGEVLPALVRAAW